MNLITLDAAREDRGLLTVTGKCGDSPDFLSYLNSALQRLLKRGDWFLSMFRLEVCVNDDCVVWPRQVGKIRAINMCKTSLLVEGQWATFMPFQAGCAGWNWNGGWGFSSAFGVEQRGVSSIFRQIPCSTEDWYVRLYIERQADIGKQVTIYGVNTHGQIIRSKKSDGVYSEGVTITASATFGSTTIPIRSISRVFLNSAFDGNARLYAYNATTDKMILIGLYEPGETEPAYVYSKLLRGCCGRNPGGCNGNRSVEALAKINSDPLRLGTDLLQIQDIEAVKMAVQAIKAEEAGEGGKARERMNAAVAECNRQQRDWLPDDQVPIQVYPWAGARLEYQRIGLIN